jgi:uncharacterized membrane protein
MVGMAIMPFMIIIGIALICVVIFFSLVAEAQDEAKKDDDNKKPH